MGYCYSISKNFSKVKEELSAIISKEIVKDYVKTSWNNNDLVIEIKKMGTSEIRINFKDEGDNCIIKEGKRNIAMMHKPFVPEVEKLVDDILSNKLGAKRT